MKQRGTHLRWMLAASLLLAGCPAEQLLPPPTLTADPPDPGTGKPPGAGLADMDRAVAYIEKEAWKEALPHLEKAIEAQPKNAEARYYRALCHKQLGDSDKAIGEFREALEIDPKLVLARVHLGELLLLAEPPQPDEAIELLEPAVKAEPKAADSRQLLAYAYYLKENWAEAAKQYEAAFELAPDDEELRFKLADALFLAGRTDESVIHMRKLLPIFKDNVKTVSQLAYRFARSLAFDDCLKAYDLAITLDAKEPAFYVQRGVCKHGLKDEKGARGDYEQAIAVKATFQPAYYYLGKSWLEEKRTTNATEWFQKAVKLGKDTEIGKKAQHELDELSAAGKKDKKGG